MGVDMSNNNPPFFPSPTLSLSLAGIFRQGAEAEGGDEGSGNTRRRDEMVEISSENSGHGRSRSEDDLIHSGEYDDEEEEYDEEKGRKKRKKYHRHTAQQIREMEALFKESPHPDEKQRQQLSKQLGLHPRQVKFWFQNRRTQIKAIQERHENSVLKSELERIKEENKSLREVIQKSCCPSCGFGAITNRDITFASTTDDQQLINENARLKAEVEKLKAIIGKKNTHGTSFPQEEATNDEEKRSSIDQCTGVVGVEKSKIMEVVEKALEELKKMAFVGEPLWVKSVESRREILNYDEYIKEFIVKGSSATTSSPRWSIEASRESRVVFVDLSKLLQCFMDVSQWKEMFPCLISKAAMMDVISVGEGPNKNNAVQLMYAELQMLTPLVPTREVCFVRYCKQLSSDQWAIVDVSIDKEEDSSGTSLMKYRKRPSGCIIEDKSNGHCKITWVEHLECQKVPVHSLYRSIVNSGIAFGARHWMSTLQLQCERLVFFMATNIPTKDSSGVATLAGRKSILKLAQRMTWRFCWAIGASSLNSWTKFTTKTGEDVRVSSRNNLNDPSEPIGTIMCAVSSVWLPVSPSVLFDFLRDDTQRHKWDIMASGGQVQSIAYLAKGQDRGNAVSVQTITSKDNIQVLQDSCTNDYESMVVYAPVDVSAMQSVMTGCDSSNVAVLPSGFSILPDGVELRPLVLMSRQEDNRNGEGGSLLTIALQTVTNNSPAKMSSVESVESVTCLISCILANIRTCLQCEDG